MMEHKMGNKAQSFFMYFYKMNDVVQLLKLLNSCWKEM